MLACAQNLYRWRMEEAVGAGDNGGREVGFGGLVANAGEQSSELRAGHDVLRVAVVLRVFRL
jgi:hypothetical protein